MDLQQIMEQATQTAIEAATPPPVLATDKQVADALGQMALCGYIPSAGIIEPLRHILTGRSVLLTGKVGTGKTFLFRALGYNIHPAEDIADYGMSGIHEWLEDRAGYRIIIDDLGSERKAVEFGAKDELMRTVIAWRAERTTATTHVTTNLSGVHIAERYGERTLSRLLGMCKPFELTGPDRRIAGGAR